MTCQLCKYFEGEVPLLPLNELCDECQTWLTKVCGVRRKYFSMVKDLYKND